MVLWFSVERKRFLNWYISRSCILHYNKINRKKERKTNSQNNITTNNNLKKKRKQKKNINKKQLSLGSNGYEHKKWLWILCLLKCLTNNDFVQIDAKSPLWTKRLMHRITSALNIELYASSGSVGIIIPLVLKENTINVLLFTLHY